MLDILQTERDGFERICKPFYSVRAVRKVVDLGISARNIEELKEGARKIGIHSLFYHLVTSRLRHGEPTNDFSRWLREIGGEGREDRVLV